jgi:hypothetical protein
VRAIAAAAFVLIAYTPEKAVSCLGISYDEAAITLTLFGLHLNSSIPTILHLRIHRPELHGHRARFVVQSAQGVEENCGRVRHEYVFDGDDQRPEDEVIGHAQPPPTVDNERLARRCLSGCKCRGR